MKDVQTDTWKDSKIDRIQKERKTVPKQRAGKLKAGRHTTNIDTAYNRSTNRQATDYKQANKQTDNKLPTKKQQKEIMIDRARRADRKMGKWAER